MIHDICKPISITFLLIDTEILEMKNDGNWMSE